MIPGTLPIGGTLLGAIRAPFLAPRIFAKAFGPMFAVGLVASLGEADALWPTALGAFNTLVLATLFCTNWHRHLILGAAPGWGWGRPETRYLVVSIMLGLLVVVPPYFAAADTYAAFDALADQGHITIALALAIPVAPLVAFAVMLALSVPLWLWLPSEAIGRDESYEAISALAQGERLRFFLATALALGGTLAAAWAMEAVGLPGWLTGIAMNLCYPVQIGVMSIAYRHLDSRGEGAVPASALNA
jgi:hypothetical protein